MKRLPWQVDFDNEDDRRTGRLIVWLILASIVTDVIAILAGLYWMDRQLIIATAAGTVFQAAPYWLLRRGHLHAAGLVFVVGVLGTLTASATLGQGIHDYAIIAYPIVIVFAGLALPGIGFRFSVILTLLSLGWLVFGESGGWFIPRPAEAPTLIDFFIMAVIIVIGGLAVHRLTTNMRRSLGQAMQEVAQRRRAEEALKLQDMQLSTILESTGDGILAVDGAGRVIKTNQRFADIWQVPSEILDKGTDEALLTHVLGQLVDPDAFVEKVLALYASTAIDSDIIRFKDGRIVERYSCPLESEGVISGRVWSFRDVTERRRVEAALERARFSIDFSPDYTLWADSEGHFVDVSGSACARFGYTREEFLTLSIFDITLRASAAAWPDRWREVKRCGTLTLERQYRTKAGEIFPVEITTTIFDYEGREYVLLTVRDITQRKHDEQALRERDEQLRQSQKMEAVGQLAGGIAHDFNNLLSAILGYSDLLLDGPELAGCAAREDVMEIKQAAERASALTRQILAFSRRQALRPRVASLNDVLDGMEPLLRRTIGEHIELVSQKDPGLGQVEIDVHQFEQVLMNLAVNARDAMPSGGRLTLKTANAVLDERYCQTHPEATPGIYVMLSVSDTGLGMDETTRERIFEPFFTTKATGAGTGLGLAMVHGIVNQSHGSISVESEPGKGAGFSIYLPRVTGSVPEEILASGGATATRGQETILLVEDEVSLRNLVARVLSGLGYRVLEAGTAAEALQVARQADGSLGLLLTDVVLPGDMQGNDLARDLLASTPDLPVLYVSGYPRDAIVSAGRLEPGLNFLEKPFAPEALAAMVRAVLNKPRASG